MRAHDRHDSSFSAVMAGLLIFKRFWPRYHMVLVTALGVGLAAIWGHVPWHEMPVKRREPLFIQPQWSLASTLSLALPLVMVSLTGQFLPGMVILRNAGYDTPARPIIVITSLASLGAALFGGISTVLAAITAALCTGKDAHEDPSRRYVAGVANGVFYLLAGSFGGSVIWLFIASGMVLLGLGSAFWGVVISMCAHWAHGLKKPASA
jgi:benzoate membrane transport protein